MRPVYVASIEPNTELANQINNKHGVTWHEVEEAVLWPARHVRATWHSADITPQRGRRIVIEGRTVRGRALGVVSYPVDDADRTWRLGAAVGLS